MAAFLSLSTSFRCHSKSPLCKSLELHHGDSTLLTLPLNYSFGLSVVNTHIFVGAKLGSISVTPVEKKSNDLDGEVVDIRTGTKKTSDKSQDEPNDEKKGKKFNFFSPGFIK